MDVWEMDADEDGMIVDSQKFGKTQVATDRFIAQREWDKLQNRHANAGYREGLSDARDDATLQEGFDQGYNEAAGYGLECGRLNGILAALKACSSKFDLYLETEKVETISKDLADVNWTTLLQPECSMDKEELDSTESAGKFSENVKSCLREYTSKVDLIITTADLDIDLQPAAGTG